eukprot:CAMPEP_0194373862 /NCGR_PEP_ID=MMETSP0174-20130528/22272_1 /TAXON_ID=216777 /ORGANISM="Proboscia alata, Strain PI-D3" /LENGTH=593 /DNA_ID=CAMNT_0039153139 /DNA_START=270 /DNA_END=2051 /DNA_ORIENTATION=+
MTKKKQEPDLNDAYSPHQHPPVDMSPRMYQHRQKVQERMVAITGATSSSRQHVKPLTPIETKPKLKRKKSLQELHQSISDPALSTRALDEIRVHFANKKNSLGTCISYGLVNTAVVLPVEMSFGAIIFSNSAFIPYLPVLIKLVVISAVVHQISFSALSSLPFAIGQVQDAGLIFLAAMANTIVNHVRARELDDSHILATATIILPLCTAFLGVGLVIIGNFRLAGYVQALPTPVIGGYLAFIGFFCGQSGLALMGGVNVVNYSDWHKFFASKVAILILPGFAGGLGIYLLARKLRHMAVLPVSIMSLLFCFYWILMFKNIPLDEARSSGWLSTAEAPPVWYHTWDFLQFDKVCWSVLPELAITEISMMLVVALSSSLDVAAIELDLGKDLDYNHELKTVGWSNIVSGMTGGYTGSYIFSQSIFSLRSGIHSRWAGLFVAFFEAVTVVSPVSILSYVPNFVFGSLLVMIAVDLMVEWLWDLRSKVTLAEYAVALSTFGTMIVFGVESGILFGILLYVIMVKAGMDVGDLSDDESETQDEEKHLLSSDEVLRKQEQKYNATSYQENNIDFDRNDHLTTNGFGEHVDNQPGILDF